MPVNYDRLAELARPKTYHSMPIIENKHKAVSLKQLGPSIERLSKPRIQQNLKKELILNSRCSQIKQSPVDDVSRPETTVKLCQNTIERQSRPNKRDEIPPLQIKNETKIVPATAGKRSERVLPRDDGEGGKAVGGGKQADSAGKKADGDGGSRSERSAVERLAAKNDSDRPRALVDRGDDRQTTTTTVSLMDYLQENSERLSQIHAECRRERWPDECFDAAPRAAEVAADDEDAAGRRRDEASASSWPLGRLVAHYPERFRRSVLAACRTATAALRGFFRRIGDALTFRFLTHSAVYSGTILERPF